jgi:hypothetical protein
MSADDRDVMRDAKITKSYERWGGLLRGGTFTAELMKAISARRAGVGRRSPAGGVEPLRNPSRSQLSRVSLSAQGGLAQRNPPTLQAEKRWVSLPPTLWSYGGKAALPTLQGLLRLARKHNLQSRAATK